MRKINREQGFALPMTLGIVLGVMAIVLAVVEMNNREFEKVLIREQEWRFKYGVENVKEIALDFTSGLVSHLHYLGSGANMRFGPKEIRIPIYTELTSNFTSGSTSITVENSALEWYNRMPYNAIFKANPYLRISNGQNTEWRRVSNTLVHTDPDSKLTSPLKFDSNDPLVYNYQTGDLVEIYPFDFSQYKFDQNDPKERIYVSITVEDERSKFNLDELSQISFLNNVGFMKPYKPNANPPLYGFHLSSTNLIKASGNWRIIDQLDYLSGNTMMPEVKKYVRINDFGGSDNVVNINTASLEVLDWICKATFKDEFGNTKTFADPYGLSTNIHNYIQDNGPFDGYPLTHSDGTLTGFSGNAYAEFKQFMSNTFGAVLDGDLPKMEPNDAKTDYTTTGNATLTVGANVFSQLFDRPPYPKWIGDPIQATAVPLVFAAGNTFTVSYTVTSRPGKLKTTPRSASGQFVMLTSDNIIANKKER